MSQAQKIGRNFALARPHKLRVRDCCAVQKRQLRGQVDADSQPEGRNWTVARATVVGVERAASAATREFCCAAFRVRRSLTRRI
jgi:hypothetical protein